METSRQNSGQYQFDRQWSDNFIPEIKAIVGPNLLEVADIELDGKQATDLIILKAKDMRIAARIRDASKYAQKYGHQFTIRSKRDSGAQTELEKIQRGWGDWFFYGFGDPESGTIVLWYLIDLHAFRYHMNRDSWIRSGIKVETQANGDGTYFKAFTVSSFPDDPPLLVAQSFLSA